jgi:hypothetical protein
MRSWSSIVGFAIAFATGGACKRWDYHCTVDDECVSDDVIGTCEAEGWCSYPDATCDGGKRWGPQAGPYANDCAIPGPGTSSSSSESTSSESMSSESSSSESSSSESSSSESTSAVSSSSESASSSSG